MSNLRTFSTSRKRAYSGDEDADDSRSESGHETVDYVLSDLCLRPAPEQVTTPPVNVEPAFSELMGSDLKVFAETGTRLARGELAQSDTHLYFTGMYQGLAECLIKGLVGGTESTKFKFFEAMLFLLPLFGVDAQTRLSGLAAAFCGGACLKTASLERLRKTLLGRKTPPADEPPASQSAEHPICGELWPRVAQFFNLAQVFPNVSFSDDLRIDDVRFRKGDASVVDKPQEDKVHLNFANPAVLCVYAFKTKKGFETLRLIDDDIRKIKTAVLAQLSYRGSPPSSLEVAVCRNRDIAIYSGYTLNPSKLLFPTFLLCSEGCVTLSKGVTRLTLFCAKLTGFPQGSTGGVVLPKLVSFATPIDGQTHDRVVDNDI